MNTSGSRWVREQVANVANSATPNEAESVVLREVLAAIRGLEFGTIQLTIQDSRVVQIDTTRRRRL